MSPRNFQRAFTSETGKTRARLGGGIAFSRHRGACLERRTQSIDEITDRCGFASADVLGRAFTRVLLTAPSEYRSRFLSSGIGKRGNHKSASCLKADLYWRQAWRIFGDAPLLKTSGYTV